MKLSITTCCLLLVCGVAATGQELVLTENGRTDYVICVADEPASPADMTAARELQQHLKQVTGVELPIVAEKDADSDRPRIFVGTSAGVRKLLPKLDVAKLPDDAIVMKTVGRDLILVGKPPRGTLYAVYTFLEDSVGVRWWTSTESTIPKKPKLVVPRLDIVYAPPLRYREAYYRDMFNGVFAARMKCNGNMNRIADEYGGHWRFAGFVHTFYPLIPPSKYFDAHPDWFSEIDGKRKHERGQLCLTNEAMRKELVRNAIEWIRKQPGTRIISISQNDWHGRCQCERCRAVETSEESPAGPLVHFVNRVAQEIEREFPDVLVETLAYQYTRQPPKHVRPRKNVIIRLCSIECSFVQPLTGKQNEKFRRDIEGWSKVAPQLFVWDYVTNFHGYILPHPNMRVLAPNLRFFVDHKVVGLFEQGDAGCSVGDFVRLRAWLLAHLMWSPRADEKRLIDEFLTGYYGPAAPHLAAYLDTIHDAGDPERDLRCFMSGTASWLSLDDLNAATQHFAKALEAVEDSPTYHERVRRERLPLDHVWLRRYKQLQRQAQAQGKKFLAPEDPHAAVEEFITIAKRYNVVNYRERYAFAELEQSLRRRFRPPGTPPSETKGLSADDWIDVQDNEFNLGRLGQWATTADDPTASDKHAARMPGNHREWALQWPITKDLAYGNPWRCYMQVRCETKATDGPAMTMGIYDLRSRKSVAWKKIEAADVTDGKYHTIDLGTHELKEGMYIWAAPPQRPDDVTAVYVDRIFLVREKNK